MCEKDVTHIPWVSSFLECLVYNLEIRKKKREKKNSVSYNIHLRSEGPETTRNYLVFFPLVNMSDGSVLLFFFSSGCDVTFFQ